MSGSIRFRSTGFFCVLCIGLLACQSAPAPQETYYRLTAEIQPGVADPKACGTILVGRLGTHGFAGARAIVFRDRKDALQVQRYHYRLWTEPPALMIQDAVARALRATGLTRYVITPVERANADWIVSGSLIRLEQYPNASPPEIEMQIELGIVSAKTRETLLLERYVENQPAKSNRIEDAVRAFDQALERVLIRFQKDAGNVLRSDRAVCEEGAP